MKKFFIFVLLLFSGCSTYQTQKDINQITLSTTSDPKSFNPIIAKETSTTNITTFIFEGLVEMDGVTLEVKPSLAYKWQIDKSGKKWIFYLRDDVYWNDGEKFSADDVIFTYNDLIYNESIPTSSRDVLTVDGKQINVKKVDDYTVEFQLPEKFAPFLKLMTQEIFPKHILEKNVLNGTITSTWGVNEKVNNIVGTGPYKMKEYRPGEWVILEKNEKYWKKDEKGNRLPYIPKIIFLIIPDPNMTILKFRTGDIDIISIRGQDFSVLEPYQKKENFTIYEIGPSHSSNFLSLNQNVFSPIDNYKIKWFKNLYFRKAIAHSIDKKNIIKNVFNGLAVPQVGPMTPSCGFYYNKNLPDYEYNLSKARQYLLKGGFHYKQRKLFDNENNQIRFTILTNSDNFERIQIGNVIINDLEKLGMDVNLLPVEFNTLVTKLSVTNDWEGVIIGFTGGIEPHFSKNVWMSYGQLHLWNMGQKKILEEWEKEIDFLFDEGAKELNENKRKVIYDRWQEIVQQQLPLIHTVNPLVIYAVRNKFGNLKPSVYGGVLHNIEEIYVKGCI